MLTGDSATLPHWSVADVHESLEGRSFTAALEEAATGVARLIALFDRESIRAVEPRQVDETDGRAADHVIDAYNRVAAELTVLHATVRATTAVDSLDETAQSLTSELADLDAQLRPLLARLAGWVDSLGVDALAGFSNRAAEHRGPLARFAARATHQMADDEEHLYSELSTTGSGAWTRLHSQLTSQLVALVDLPIGQRVIPMAAVRGLATDPDPTVRQAGYDAELDAWPDIEVSAAAALNAIKGEANVVNRRRRWQSPLEASLFANSVSRQTFDAMSSAVDGALPDFRRWMRTKARLHGRDSERGLPWWDLVAPLPTASGSIAWEEGVGVVRDAFARYSPRLRALVDRSLAERWIDAEPRAGKSGGAFCTPFVGDRSLVLLNWSDSLDSVQTAAHELGHAYHNTTLAHRTPLQRRLPMALAETASIFCETLVVDAGLAATTGADRLALLDVDLRGACQIVVDIRSRFLFESEVFARRRRRTLSAGELSELMNDCQERAYGDGLDQATAHPYMWVLKGHYYGWHFYNWPYTYGLLFGLGLFARYQDDPDRFRSQYDDVLSRAGMDTAEELGAAFGLDVTEESFWNASLDVLRARIDDHARLADDETAPDHR